MLTGNEPNHVPTTETAALTVTVYVSAHCFVCEYAYELVELIGAEFPQVAVMVVDMADPDAEIPDLVFATPTWLLDGRLWSLGNPSPQQVRETLHNQLASRQEQLQ
jgi:hypothetical protein